MLMKDIVETIGTFNPDVKLVNFYYGTQLAALGGSFTPLSTPEEAIRVLPSEMLVGSFSFDFEATMEMLNEYKAGIHLPETVEDLMEVVNGVAGFKDYLVGLTGTDDESYIAAFVVLHELGHFNDYLISGKSALDWTLEVKAAQDRALKDYMILQYRLCPSNLQEERMLTNMSKINSTIQAELIANDYAKLWMLMLDSTEERQVM